MLLSSVLWNFTPVFEQAVGDIDAGTFGEQGYVLSVDNGISLLRTDKADDSVWDQVDEAQTQIAAGEIEVPETATLEEVQALINS